jgi:hypothetical protein
VVLGLEAADAKNAYDAAPVQATYDHASSMQTWTTVVFVAGGVWRRAGSRSSRVRGRGGG